MTIAKQPATVLPVVSTDHAPPHQSYSKLFLRFLRYGFLAWGGPVAQIGMIRQELVDEEKWISNERFNRVLAVYQVLPGPEAHELCVYFGMQARGRIGGLLAGLGFMLPGFSLMLFLSWFYVNYGISSPVFEGAFYGMQAVVGALIVRAVYRIGGHALHNYWLYAAALLGFIAQLVGVNFALTLITTALFYVLTIRGQIRLAATLWISALLIIILWQFQVFDMGSLTLFSSDGAGTSESVNEVGLFGSGLRSGLLTFGGAYTVIPFLQNDAVVVGGWMSNAQFLDGLALSGILPAPLVIFGTFVGYMGGGLAGAIAVTIGIFFPAFAFTLVGHNFMERLIENKSLTTFLDGVTAGVVGLIAATTLVLLRDALTDIPAAIIFGVGLVVLFRWKSKLNVPVVVVVAAIVGYVVINL